jgi:hypothetical protein
MLPRILRHSHHDAGEDERNVLSKMISDAAHSLIDMSLFTSDADKGRRGHAISRRVIRTPPVNVDTDATYPIHFCIQHQRIAKKVKIPNRKTADLVGKMLLP